MLDIDLTLSNVILLQQIMVFRTLTICLVCLKKKIIKNCWINQNNHIPQFITILIIDIHTILHYFYSPACFNIYRATRTARGILHPNYLCLDVHATISKATKVKGKQIKLWISICSFCTPNFRQLLYDSLLLNIVPFHMPLSWHILSLQIQVLS